MRNGRHLHSRRNFANIQVYLFASDGAYRLLRGSPAMPWVVDWDCGPGRHTIPVAQSIGGKGKVFVVDIHPLAIKTIREKAEQNGLRNVETILISSYDTGIQNASVDLVLLIDIVPIVKETKPLFKEIHRLLKGKGRAYVSHIHLSMAKTRKLVEDSGLFNVSECKGHDMMIVPIEKQDSKSS